MSKDKLPEEDVEMINKSFSVDKSVDSIDKDAKGSIITAKKVIMSPSGVIIRDYRGKRITRKKSLYENGKNIVVAEKGQKYDDVDPQLRSKVNWSDADFA